MNYKPNIVCILADDMGAWAMGCAGNREIQTPTLDALAKDGIRFENFFCASPVCSPARASLMTGRMPSAHGVHDWLCGGNLDMRAHADLQDQPVFALEHTEAIRYLDGMTTYTDLLARNGYTCALAGKWHLGDSVTPQHGFSRWYTIARGGCDYYHSDMVSDGRVVWEDGYVTDRITARALTDLDVLCAQDAPFYLSVHYTAPHSPWDEAQHPKRWLDRYRDCTFADIPDLPPHPRMAPTAPRGEGERRKELLRGYYAAISAMDEGIGRLIAHLKAQGVYEQTVLLFIGDNGMNMGQHGIWGKGNGTFPANMYDTSVKVPCMLKGPGLAHGRVETALCSHCDVLPTIAEMLGEHLQDTPLVCGHSLLPILRGESGAAREEVLVFDEYGPTRMIRTRTHKLVRRYPYPCDEFYDLTRDPGEEENRIDDPAYADMIREMSDRMCQWFDRYSDPRLDARAEAVSGFGQLRRQGVYSHGLPVWYHTPTTRWEQK